ncbi:HAD-like protein [Phellopilus nigrolimitatus]|nr:HAD-like protein [Phellopilus nigrolimitatus]
MTSTTFRADAVLFDMDGTLTDSIAAVEAAWGAVAVDLGLDPETVIAATHGKRAVDNLAQFRPEIKPHEMEGAVAAFEQSILDFADSFQKRAARRRSTGESSPGFSASAGSDSGESTPGLSPTSGFSSRSGSLSTPSSSSIDPSTGLRRPSFATRLSDMLASAIPEDSVVPVFDESADDKHADEKQADTDIEAAWETEADSVDRSIRILPGVKNMIECIPDGRYAVATSGANTYGSSLISSASFLQRNSPALRTAYGAMTRVGITPPPVTITADDKRLKAGKPAPDPFLLAASCLGFDAKRCVVFEDSPSGIRAGVASGATVIAVCTSHERSKIENCGAHFVVEDMRKVRCRTEGEGAGMQLAFTVEH